MLFRSAEAPGAGWWPLAMARELDDAILLLRFNEPEIGTWVLRSQGDPEAVAAVDRTLLSLADHWLVREVTLYLKRTLKRLELSSRSLIALVEPGGCFAGALLDLALACDRQYMLDGPPPDDETSELRASLTLSESNLGPLPMANGLTRLATRFGPDEEHLARLAKEVGRQLAAAEALELGLVTATPDDLDWPDEIRIVVEERTALSPDALTAMEANLRFAGPETLQTKVFGRLTAWQNWVFTRPNASGERGALRRYGTGQRAEFDHRRV